MEKQSDGRTIKHPEFGHVKFTKLTLRQQDVLDYLAECRRKHVVKCRKISVLKRMCKRYPNDKVLGEKLRKLLM